MPNKELQNYWEKWLKAENQLRREDIIRELPIARFPYTTPTILNSYFEDLAEFLGKELP